MRRFVHLLCNMLQTALAYAQVLQGRITARAPRATELADHGTAFGLDATMTGVSSNFGERRG